MRLSNILKNILVGRLYDSYGHAGYNDYIEYANSVIVDYTLYNDYSDLLNDLTKNYKQLIIY